ncbi:hypothetical protein PCIT_a1884 [Pseudoalteromonas citrea]|uniref:Uncharacterized protein n=2 Tax=Pseudoalteromonas citrea TaxID=43655 RepID=A0AAD4AIU9_9GAMM|nr:hypothetical protein [Pseudoalteromonas citrea]KAF7771918.1 hypothetical protein PCIT_a1884 [Pseudoalteromonas citrea]
MKFSLNKVKLKNLSNDGVRLPLNLTPQIAGASINGGCVTGETITEGRTTDVSVTITDPTIGTVIGPVTGPGTAPIFRG